MIGRALNRLLSKCRVISIRLARLIWIFIENRINQYSLYSTAQSRFSRHRFSHPTANEIQFEAVKNEISLHRIKRMDGRSRPTLSQPYSLKISRTTFSNNIKFDDRRIFRCKNCERDGRAGGASYFADWRFPPNAKFLLTQQLSF